MIRKICSLLVGLALIGSVNPASRDCGSGEISVRAEASASEHHGDHRHSVPSNAPTDHKRSQHDCSSGSPGCCPVSHSCALTFTGHSIALADAPVGEASAFIVAASWPPHFSLSVDTPPPRA